MFLRCLKFRGDLLTMITWELLWKLKKKQKQTELHGPNFFVFSKKGENFLPKLYSPTAGFASGVMGLGGIWGYQSNGHTLRL